ncbi:hypothetical protein GCM10023311_00500 [Flaviramulus aquimarinus]|uniref:Type IX secretion system membrane protein PorP/SprF n=1 Tax=Flaviramulus aquimarinus TaxID=1170456 RepID=A0ABP9ELI4_9FLAO
MKNYILYIVLLLSLTQLYAQDDGVVALTLPVRNSLKFNKYAINPTLSFVREQNKYISFSNNRQWVQFDDAPQTYLFSYSGRFRENMGIGVGVFQQNYGVLTTFGGILNAAYNATLNRDNNLTFGINLGFYKSGINDGKVITNSPDPSLNNIPSNTLITINPGLNYGTTFLDFGVSINNFVAYNLTTSTMIEDNPEQSVQAHVMYTGYLDARGFFDESKFSSLVRSEFKKDQTVISGIMMLTVPKGFWGQIGYNSLYGISAGIGLNISTQIAIEYNYEKAIGDLSSFGNSHDITLAYKFKNRYRYDYSGDDDEAALLFTEKKKSRIAAKRRATNKPKVDRNAIAEEKAKAKVIAAEKVKAKADTRAKLVAEAKARREAKIQSVAETKDIQDAQVNLAETENVKAEQEAQAKLAEAERVKAEQETQTKLAEAARVEAEQEAQAKLVEAEREKAEQEAQAKLAEAERVKAEQEAQAKLVEAARVKAEQEAQAKLAEAASVKSEREENEQRIDTLELDGVLVNVAKDREALAMKSLTELTENSKIEQQDLLVLLREKVASKQQDLNDLKEENDLSEQGIYSAPKAFKSVTAENAALETLQLQIDKLIESQNVKISELESLYKDRLKKFRDKDDETNTFYKRKILELKSQQLQTANAKADLLSTLDVIKADTEIERNRRIKRAAYDNEQDRYVKDRAALDRIKTFTDVSPTPLTAEDFDHGEELSNIQIVKDIKNVESGYYLVIAVHSDVNKRDEFLTKAVSAGQTNINFFYDVNTSKYYIYHEKFEGIDQAKSAMNSKGSKPYNSKMSMVKIEN